MSKANIVQAVRLLSNTQGQSYDSELYGKIIELVIAPRKPVEDIIRLVNCVDPLKIKVERFWVAMFEAYLVANHLEAHCITLHANSMLQGARTLHLFSYPYLIVGFLKAACWLSEQPIEKRSPGFEENFPAIFGKLLIRFANDSCYYRPGEEEDVSTWMLGEFSLALSTYLSVSDTNERWRRVKLLSESLRSITKAGQYSKKFVAEVNSRLLHKLDLCSQTRMLSAFYEHDESAKSSVLART